MIKDILKHLKDEENLSGIDVMIKRLDENALTKYRRKIAYNKKVLFANIT